MATGQPRIRKFRVPVPREHKALCTESNVPRYLFRGGCNSKWQIVYYHMMYLMYQILLWTEFESHKLIVIVKVNEFS
jgi:hypothetical protein